MRIYLIGYMGSGKSTFGKKLANQLGFGFIDLDQRIEDSQSCSIAEIFESEGEPAFRKLEGAHLRSIKTEKVVIATGGGCPCHSENIDFMNKNGTTVYLELTASAALSRLKGGRSQRPILSKLSEDDLADFISDHLSFRVAYYENAKIKVPAIDADVEEVVRLIQAR